MICPYCKREMRLGFFPASKKAVWWQDEHTNQIVQLTKTPLFRVQKAEAHYCENCRIIIAPIKNLD